MWAASLAILALAPVVSCSNLASIYLQPSPEPLSSRAIEVSQAPAVLAHWLGVDQWDPSPSTVHEDDQQWFALMGGMSLEHILGGASKQSAMLLAIQCSTGDDIVPPSFQPSFTLHRPFTQLSTLISSYLSRAQQVYSSIFTLLPSDAQQPSPFLDIFSVHPSAATRQFVAEFQAISDFLDVVEFSKNQFGAFEITGLEMIVQEFGKESVVYKTAAQAINALLSQPVLSSIRLALVVTLPPNHTHTARAEPSSQPPQQPLPPTLPPSSPIFSSSTCFANVTICESSTSSCSGRGTCEQAEKAGKTCFECACRATRDSRGRRQVWVGTNCERLDISGPFVLLAGTGIAIVLTLVASISLLYSAGSEPLPGTLSGLTGLVRRE